MNPWVKLGLAFIAGVVLANRVRAIVPQIPSV